MPLSVEDSDTVTRGPGDSECRRRTPQSQAGMTRRGSSTNAAAGHGDRLGKSIGDEMVSRCCRNVASSSEPEVQSIARHSSFGLPSLLRWETLGGLRGLPGVGHRGVGHRGTCGKAPGGATVSAASLPRELTVAPGALWPDWRPGERSPARPIRAGICSAARSIRSAGLERCSRVQCGAAWTWLVLRSGVSVPGSA